MEYSARDSMIVKGRSTGTPSGSCGSDASTLKREPDYPGRMVERNLRSTISSAIIFSASVRCRT
jgi:hypothetical protein